MMEQKYLSSTKGMSLIEVMIVITIMSLIGLGTATLMKNMFSIQRRANIKQVVKQYQNELEALLKNDQSWAFTVNLGGNTSSLGCLRDGSAGCANAFTDTDFQVQDTANAIFFNGNSGTDGFDFNGQRCTAWTAAGNDACPFRYTLTWVAECPVGVNPCIKPQVVITGTLLYSPVDPSAINNRLNVADYAFTIRRGERVRYEPFELVYEHLSNTDSQPNGFVDGGGACLPPTTGTGRVVRPLSALSYDAGGNVTFNDATDTFTLVAGTYSCKIIAQSFEATTGFSIVLRDMTNNVDYPAGSGFSGPGTTSYASGTVEIQLTAPAGFRLEHECQNSHPDEPTWDMGIPMPAYTTAPGTTFTNISCVRTS